MELDEEMPFTDAQKYQNFLKILETVRYLDDGGRITEDWVEESKELILMYREWIPDYSQVNPEITDLNFRKNGAEAETLLRLLCHSIATHKTFDVGIFHKFMRKMKVLVETVVSDDELTTLLSMMSM